jgi:hypothetical protein
MLRAGSLYFALFISFIVTILLGSVILYASFINRYTDAQVMRDRAWSNANAGIIVALYDTAFLSAGATRVLDLYDDQDTIDKVTVSKTYWGVYQIIKSSVRWKNFEALKIAFTGADISSAEPIALYVADKDRYLSFCGATVITGTSCLPKIGIRKAYIEGQSFTGEKLINGEMRTSSSELPALSDRIIASNLTCFSDAVPEGDSLVNIDEIAGADSLEKSFNSKTLVIFSRSNITLDNIKLKGNIRVLSSQSIRFTRYSNTDNIIAYAPVIYFDKGFRGNLQAFAQDTLIANEDCEFTYPSCLGLVNDTLNGNYLEINENTRLEGCIFLYRKNKATPIPHLKIAPGTIIHGLVYCPGNVELKGKIEGSLYCHGFSLNTPSGLYENYLLNDTIDRSALSKYYSGTFLLPVFNRLKPIRWLY